MHMRRYKRSFKNNFFIIFLIIVFCISIGYAVLSKTLAINGNSEVIQNTWDIHFDNVQVTDGSVIATSLPTIDNSKTAVNFSFMLDSPGDFYEFTVDVVNDGSIDAMVSSVTKTPALTSLQQKYLNYIIEYQNGEQIQSKQLVSKDSFVRLKVRVEYKKDITASDLPQNTETLNLGFTVNYVQSDGTEESVTDDGVKKVGTAHGSLDTIGTIVTSGSEQFYTIGTEGDNVKLLAMFNLYVGNKVTGNNIVEPLENPTGMQNDVAIGNDNNYIFPYFGTTAFSNTSSTYEGSIVEGYVNDYKNTLESNFGVDVLEARLITKDELTDSESFACEYDDMCRSKYSWIYSTSYWLVSFNNEYSVNYMRSDGFFLTCGYDTDDMFGVRPVIVVAKDSIIEITNLIEFTIDGTTYQALEGRTWRAWIGSSYDTIENLEIDSTCVANDIVFVGSGRDELWDALHLYLDLQTVDDVIEAGESYTKGNND